MADAKITALTELTDVDVEDLFAVVEDPSGTPATKKATLANVILGITAAATVTTEIASSDQLRIVGTPAATPGDRRITLANFVDQAAAAIPSMNALVGSDYLRVVATPGGTPADQGITLTNFIDKAAAIVPSVSTIAATDRVRIIGTPGGTPADKAMAFSTLRNQLMPYAMIKNVNATAGTQTVGAGTPTGLTQWNTAGPTNGISASTTNGTITITATGIYMVFLQLSFQGTGAVEWKYYVTLAGTEKLAGNRMLGATGDVGSASLMGLVNATTTGDFKVWIQPDGSSKTFLAKNAQFTIFQLG